jgi:hypothetical protein
MNRWTNSIAAAAAAAAVTYCGWAIVEYIRYGRPHRRNPADRDDVLDRFISHYDVYERHTIVVNAPPAVTLAAARNQDIFHSPLINMIFKAREWVMSGSPATPIQGEGLLGTTLALGWRVLEEVPDREIVVGAVTKPWQANVVFRGIAPTAFAAFDEPAYVKIVWSLRVDPLEDGTRCTFCTETRAVATDAEAAARFRRYWALAAPGIRLIRRLGLPSMKAAAERAGATAGPSSRFSGPVEQPVL